MIAFRAHRGGTTQMGGFTAMAYNPIQIDNEDYDYGGRYHNSLWTPVQEGEEPRVVIFSGQVWVPWDGGGAQLFNGAHNTVVRIIKNGNFSTGTTIGAGVGSKGPYSNDWVCPISMQDRAQPGDSYGLHLYVFDGNSWVNGDPLHTFWCGTSL